MSVVEDFGQVLPDVVKTKDIYSFFSRSAFEKGYAYRAQGRVTGLEISDDLTRIRSKVRGGEPSPYRVDIELEFDDGRLIDLDGTCSCPIGANCKHVVATMLQALSGASRKRTSARRPSAPCRFCLTMSPHGSTVSAPPCAATIIPSM
ncbi:SWIM zinc finger domain-containing protein [Bradyrhizobium neotropicale]|uniref:SWIM zinc finger family protein n=1 Tax=Bradyrhizobium neotropicale TaxID=1497615 RepID=UPI001FEEE4AA|nr:SWIM zinc finger family protein [Bradyrhizobium neotropicale]